MSLPCCYSDEGLPSCSARRLPELPMCQHHMLRTFRDALVDGVLPSDVFAALVRQTDEYLKLGQVKRRFDHLHIMADVKRKREDERRQRIEQRAENAVVYYVRLTGGRIKIGWTTDLDSRLRSYRARAADLLAIEPGDFRTETRRHKQFAHLRFRRSEDFREDATLMRHIEGLRLASKDS